MVTRNGPPAGRAEGRVLGMVFGGGLVDLADVAISGLDVIADHHGPNHKHVDVNHGKHEHVDYIAVRDNHQHDGSRRPCDKCHRRLGAPGDDVAAANMQLRVKSVRRS